MVRTALWIAAARAAESSRVDRLFNDPWAAELAGEVGRKMLAASPPNPFLPVRTRYFDDRVAELCSTGGQLVLLGAGMDTRAYRLDLPRGLRVYEIDHPEAFVEKESVLSGAHLQLERYVVGADLSGAWQRELLGSGFRPERHTVWLAEGLFFYLEQSQVQHLLAGAAELSGPGSVFLADMFGSGLLTLPSMQDFVLKKKQAGLPLPFCTDDPHQLFAAQGWPTVEVAEPGSAEVNFGRMRALPSESLVQSSSTSRSYLVSGVR